VTVSCPLRKLPLFSPFTRDETAFMLRFKTGELWVGQVRRS